MTLVTSREFPQLHTSGALVVIPTVVVPGCKKKLRFRCLMETHGVRRFVVISSMNHTSAAMNHVFDGTHAAAGRSQLPIRCRNIRRVVNLSWSDAPAGEKTFEQFP